MDQLLVPTHAGPRTRSEGFPDVIRKGQCRYGRFPLTVRPEFTPRSAGESMPSTGWSSWLKPPYILSIPTDLGKDSLARYRPPWLRLTLPQAAKVQNLPGNLETMQYCLNV